jgi:phosphopantetheinyl transferase
MPEGIPKQEIRDFLNRVFPSLPCSPEILNLKDDTPITRKSLHENELVRLDSYRLPKRRREYLTGRICAKKVVAAAFETRGFPAFPLNRIEITTLDNGSPATRLHPTSDFSLPDISISHSKDLAVAMASFSPCGIDLQKIQEQLLRVKEKFCSAPEYERLTRLTTVDEQTALALIWCSKEAIQKRFSRNSIPLFSEILLKSGVQEKAKSCCLRLDFSLSKKQCYQADVTVAATTFSGYALALTIDTEEDNNARTA